MTRPDRLRGLRTPLANLLTAVLRRRAVHLDERALKQSAVVFSPHFDDETLGCGGTILRKRALGADVRIVFLTDGRASHRDWMPEADLARMRAREGQAAAEALGVAEADVHCLGFEETRLSRDIAAATDQVLEILRTAAPEQIFIPYRFEPPDDHSAAFHIVTRALRSLHRPVLVFEYPIWVWVQWPWTALPDHSFGELPRALVRQWRTLRRFFEDFRWMVETPDLVARKRYALEQHRSQLFRPPEHAEWPVLGDVRGGDFLQRFLQEFEIFARIPIQGIDDT